MKTLLVILTCFGTPVAFVLDSYDLQVLCDSVVSPCYRIPQTPQERQVLRRDRMYSRVRKLRVFALVLALFGLIALSTGLAYGQTTSGNIVGTVIDSSGAAVVNADVTATNV